uniref:BURP domain-containing protein n=1 Tax=Leersia perrieri TaxID=77586 RepID=A0A0D9Y0Z6_9ORYZ
MTILLVAAVVLDHHPAVAGDAPAPAVKFWEKALPGIPMPKSIADLVKEGSDHSPLADTKQHSNDTVLHPDICLSYRVNCPPGSAEAAAVEASGLFFHETAARAGATMTVFLPPASTKPFISRDVADKIPFHVSDDVLTMFNIAPGSTEAAKMRDTLRGCDAPPLTGELKACATSLEAIVEAADRMLGVGGGGMWAAASALDADGLPQRKYAVESVAPLDGGDARHVACHGVRWPFAVFQCHATAVGETKAYTVTLRSGGATVVMAALCHRDTSGWDPQHPAFAILGTHPGGAPVCHFMPYSNLLFGKKPTNA